MKQGYSLTEAAEIMDMSRRTLKVYADMGIVRADVDMGGGKGTTRLYSRRNLFEFLLVQELVQAGVRLEKIGGLIRGLRRETLHMYLPENQVWYITVYDANSDEAVAKVTYPMRSPDYPILIPQRIRKHDDPELPQGLLNKEEFFRSAIIINCAWVWDRIKL